MTHCAHAIDVGILRTLALSRPRHRRKELFIVLGIAQVLLQLFHRVDLIHFREELAQEPGFFAVRCVQGEIGCMIRSKAVSASSSTRLAT